MGKTEPRTLPGFMELLPSEQILFDDMKQKIEKENLVGKRIMEFLKKKYEITYNKKSCKSY